MLEGFGAPKLKKIDAKEVVERHPNWFSIEEIVQAELPNAKSELREELSSLLNEYFDKKAIEHEKELEIELEKEAERAKEWEKYTIEQKKEERQNIKKEKLKILQELKEMMDDAFIKEQRDTHYYEHYGQKDIWKFWVGFAAKVLAKTYFDKINKKASKRELDNLKDEIKNEYYQKKNPPISKPSGPIKNFYESTREQMEGLPDEDLDFFK